MDLKIFIDKNNRIIISLREKGRVMAKDSWSDNRNLDKRLLMGIDRILRRVNIKVIGIDKIDFLSESPSFMVNLLCGVIVDNLRFAKNL